jgi:hypothetical protein
MYSRQKATYYLLTRSIPFIHLIHISAHSLEIINAYLPHPSPLVEVVKLAWYRGCDHIRNWTIPENLLLFFQTALSALRGQVTAGVRSQKWTHR